jgi:hypothetical protein
MFRSHARRGVLVAVLAAGSIGACAGIANASGPTTHYQLTPKEHTAACGTFHGTIIFGDGSGSIDCSSGVATIPNDPFS